MKYEKDWMLIAIKEAQKAYVREEIPVGAVIVKNGKLVSKGHNIKEKKQNVIKHAEIVAIEKACKKFKTWHLEDCIIYVTLEPCMMCTGAITQSRVKKIIYAANNPNYGFIKSNYDIRKNSNIDIEQLSDVHSVESVNLLKHFFKKKRK